ncbi:MAG: lytic murein transglycosylase [Halofilum sp. (in: g-proteobacteria)]|nr:lytic murein transglycosylase [Halofilum sp. (in: g-proteobacteria)]
MIISRTKLRIGLGAVLLAAATAAPAMTGEAFQACLARLQDTATAQGVSPAVAERALRDVEFVERVIELDRAQPEFTTTFDDYLGRRVTQERVERGRELLAEHRDLLERVYREYGVPPRYLVAFWGMETNFGDYFGRMPILDSLATLACDDRRSGYFTRQVVAALGIIDEGSIEAERMKGSWAGALGHMQFMPTVFARYAVDFDGDGRRDPWNSIADAMGSAGNFLSGVGWEQGWRWGREVTLPEGFDYALAGYDNARAVAEWKRLGVRTAYDRPLAASEHEAALLVPSGHEGPKFLVYQNFDVIMRWNQSEFYALAVGHLADRLTGVTGLVNPPPEDAPRLRRDQVMALQERLNERGFDAGPVDGIPGPQTRAAIRRFQAANGMIADGFASRELLDALSLQVAEGP